MENTDIEDIEQQIHTLTTQLNELRKANKGDAVPN